MLEVKWLGHASFRLEANKIIYIDPWKLSKDTPKADIILVTHPHYDHFSIEDIKLISKETTTVVAPAECARQLKDIKEISAGQTLFIGDVKIEALPAYNIKKPYHHKANGWLGYIITVEGVRVYHAGDTDYIEELEELKDIDIALLPIGGTYTMDAKEAAQAANSFKPKLAIPMHYGTIVGSASDVDAFKRACQVKFRVIEPTK